MPGYISLHRDIQKHWLYEEERVFSRYEAWLDILMRVNHAEGKVTHNGTVETVLRGSTIWSMGDMEKHWGWSNKKVKRFLLCLVSDQMLSMKSTTKKTYLTVINYDKYQGSDVDKAPPTHHQSTTEAFQKHTNNNVNNSFITTTTDEPLTLDKVHLKVFGQMFMTGLMSDFVQTVKGRGYTDTFLIELMLETGESGNKPSIRLMQTIFKRWDEEKIYTRAESKRRKDSEKIRIVPSRPIKEDPELESRRMEIARSRWINEGGNPDEFRYNSPTGA